MHNFSQTEVHYLHPFHKNKYHKISYYLILTKTYGL